MPTWSEAVVEATIIHTLTSSSKIITAHDFRRLAPWFNQNKPNNGKTIINTIYRELQKLRDLGVFKFFPKKESGKYEFITHPSEARKKAKRKGDSRGELMVEEILTKINLEYQKQFVDKRIKHKRPLRFDFMFVWNEMNILLELDGAFHHQVIVKSSSHVKNVVNFFNGKHRDQIKDSDAPRLGYKLLRVKLPENLTMSRLMKSMKNVFIENNLSDLYNRLKIECK